MIEYQPTPLTVSEFLVAVGRMIGSGFTDVHEYFVVREKNGGGWVAMSEHGLYLPATDPDEVEAAIAPVVVNPPGRLTIPRGELAAPEYGTVYFVPLLYSEDKNRSFEWRGDEDDMRFLNLGIVHLSAEKAIAHADALLSLTRLS